MKTFEDFERAFPRLFSGPLISFDVPPGWVDVVWQLCAELEPLGVIAHQVKEKFGGLRFYVFEGESSVVDHLIEAAERQCDVTCQTCGAPGSLGKKAPHWVNVMCPAHTPKDVEQDVPGVLKGEPFWLPCPECRMFEGHKMDCSQGRRRR